MAKIYLSATYKDLKPHRDMVWLPGGTFGMGQGDSPYDSEKPAHRVRLDTFSVGQYPVTFAEYDLFCEVEGIERPDDRGWGRGDRPVINVDWKDVQACCDWLSAQTGERYQLLSQAQWEYACRGGNPGRYCFGDEEAKLDACAWYAKNADGKTHPVGKKRPNAWHLYDMHGSVWDWGLDRWGLAIIMLVRVFTLRFNPVTERVSKPHFILHQYTVPSRHGQKSSVRSDFVSVSVSMSVNVHVNVYG